jgi:release factor glutamine methyltransferase
LNLHFISETYLAELNKIYSQHESTAIRNLIFEKNFGKNFRTKFLEKNSEGDFCLLQNILFRLSANEPPQYILEEAYFLNCKIKVNRNVLIPRPETEELVLKIITENKTQMKSKINIIDFCTGSGCIAIGLKKKFVNAQIEGMDVSKKAIDLAIFNSTTNETEIDFFEADIFHFKTEKKYDLMVSNPPYISSSEMKSLEKNVLKFEPIIALIADENPLKFYKQIKIIADKNLKQHGKIYLEINSSFIRETEEIFSEQYITQAIKDMFGNYRFLIATKK